jgi:NAD(P)H-dependent FMN reductase
MNIVVIYGSVRTGRQGIKGAKFLINKLRERKHKVIFIDPKEYKLPLLTKRLKDYKKGKAPKVLTKLASILKKADAFLIVTAEYNYSIPPALSNLLDHFNDEYNFRPAAIASYSAGGFGGVRSAIQLQTMLTVLGMTVTPTTFAMSKIQDSFDDKGKALDDSYEQRVPKFLDELEWYAKALKTQRKKGLPY